MQSAESSAIVTSAKSDFMGTDDSKSRHICQTTAPTRQACTTYGVQPQSRKPVEYSLLRLTSYQAPICLPHFASSPSRCFFSNCTRSSQSRLGSQQ